MRRFIFISILLFVGPNLPAKVVPADASKNITLTINKSDLEGGPEFGQISTQSNFLKPVYSKNKKVFSVEFTDEIPAGSIWEKLGFRKNDVLLKVNRAKVDSTAVVMELFSSLKEKNKASALIRRDNEELNLQIQVEN